MAFLRQNMLCLDLGTTMGWATHQYTDTQPIIQSGSITLKNRKENRYGALYHNFFKWLDDKHKEIGQLDAVFYEQVINHPRRNGTLAAHIYGGFAATLTLWCEINQIPYTSLNVKTIKRLSSGYGNASKDIMIQTIKLRGHAPKDDNEADALSLLYATQQYSQVVYNVSPDNNKNNKK